MRAKESSKSNVQRTNFQTDYNRNFSSLLHRWQIICRDLSQIAFENSYFGILIITCSSLLFKLSFKNIGRLVGQNHVSDTGNKIWNRVMFTFCRDIELWIQNITQNKHFAKIVLLKIEVYYIFNFSFLLKFYLLCYMYFLNHLIILCINFILIYLNFCSMLFI